MSEGSEAMHRRVAGDLRIPEVESWDTWPFVGPVTPRTLDAPVSEERSRSGEAGVDCRACARTNRTTIIWESERWQLQTFDEPSGLPLILLLEPRAHDEEPGDLPDDLAAEFGVLVGRIERAMTAIPGVARVHVSRWGEGAAHLHWWFLARPAGFEQLRSSFAAIWDEVLPPVPEPIWRENLAAFLTAFEALS